jgi:hypothetical protein
MSAKIFDFFLEKLYRKTEDSWWEYRVVVRKFPLDLGEQYYISEVYYSRDKITSFSASYGGHMLN